MKTSSLDILENARLPPEQARAILQVMEVELSDRCDQLVTQAYLNTRLSETEHRLRGEIQHCKSDLQGEIRSLQTEFHGLRADFHGLEARVATRINGLLVSMTGIFAILLTLYTGIMGVFIHYFGAK